METTFCVCSCKQILARRDTHSLLSRCACLQQITSAQCWQFWCSQALGNDPAHIEIQLCRVLVQCIDQVWQKTALSALSGCDLHKHLISSMQTWGHTNTHAKTTHFHEGKQDNRLSAYAAPQTCTCISSIQACGRTNTSINTCTKTSKGTGSGWAHMPLQFIANTSCIARTQRQLQGTETQLWQTFYCFVWLKTKGLAS